MPKKSAIIQTKYKLWLHLEKIEIDAKGNEHYTQGEMIGYEPTELYCSESIDATTTIRDEYEKIAATCNR